MTFHGVPSTETEATAAMVRPSGPVKSKVFPCSICALSMPSADSGAPALIPPISGVLRRSPSRPAATTCPVWPRPSRFISERSKQAGVTRMTMKPTRSEAWAVPMATLARRVTGRPMKADGPSPAG